MKTQKLLNYRKESENSYIMMTKKYNNYYRINKTAYIIFDLYDKGLSTGEIIKKLIDDYKLSNEIAEKYIKDCLYMLSEKRGYPLEVELKGPIRVGWRITYRCNQMCRHCLFGSNETQYNELSTDDCYKVISKLNDGKVFSILMTGGELFIRRDIGKIINRIVKTDMSLSIFTNATLVPKWIDDLKGFDINFFVSLDGLEKEHDALRGKGSFKKALTGIKLLMKYDKPIAINIVLSTLNYKDIDLFMKYLTDMGLHFTINLFIPGGRGERSSELCLSQEQRRYAMEKIERAYRETDIIGTWVDTSNIGRPKLLHFAKDSAIITSLDNQWMCNGGHTKLDIHPDGSVYPCPFVDLPLGNILTDSLKDLWLSENRYKFIELVRDSNSFICKPIQQFICKSERGRDLWNQFYRDM